MLTSLLIEILRTHVWHTLVCTACLSSAGILIVVLPGIIVP